MAGESTDLIIARPRRRHAAPRRWRPPAVEWTCRRRGAPSTLRTPPTFTKPSSLGPGEAGARRTGVPGGKIDDVPPDPYGDPPRRGAPDSSARLTTVASTFDPCLASTLASTACTAGGASSGRTVICDASFKSTETDFLPIRVFTLPRPTIGPVATCPRRVCARGAAPPERNTRSLSMNFTLPTITSASLTSTCTLWPFGNLASRATFESESRGTGVTLTLKTPLPTGDATTVRGSPMPLAIVTETDSLSGSLTAGFAGCTLIVQLTGRERSL